MAWEIIGTTCTSWTPDTWINFGTAVITLTLTVGVWLAWSQLQQTRKNTNLQLILTTSSLLRSDEALEALRSFYRLTSKEMENLDKLSPSQIAVLDAIEMLGEMVNEKLVDEDPIVRIWAGTLALRCWYKLHDYIGRQRKKRGTIYCENLEDLASRALEYAKKKRKRRILGWIRLYVEDGEVDSGEDIIDKIIKGDVLRPRRIKDQL